MVTQSDRLRQLDQGDIITAKETTKLWRKEFVLTSNLKSFAEAKTQEGKDTKQRAESTRANSAFSFSCRFLLYSRKKKTPLNGTSYLPNLSSCLLVAK